MSFDALGIVSDNISESLKFYELLGVNFQLIGEGHYEAKSQGGVRLMLDSVDLLRKINPEWQHRKGSGITLCFKQESAAAVDGLFEKICNAGYSGEKPPWDAFWGQRYSSVLDPGGHQVDIFADL